MCKICSKLKAAERRLVFLWLIFNTLTHLTHYSAVFIIDFEKVNGGWIVTFDIPVAEYWVTLE